jgi:iron(III) transport system substrate-binding protein
MRPRKFSRRQVLKAATALATVAVFPEPLKAAAPEPSVVGPASIAAARKEGAVAFYTAMDIPVAEQLGKRFEARYPGIAVRVKRSGAERVFQRIGKEEEIQIYEVDVVCSTDAAHFVHWKREGLLAPYVPEDLARHLPAEQADADGMYATLFGMLSPIGYNTNLVKPADLPKSFDDYLDPKWKGKTVWSGTVMGAMIFITAVRTFMGEEKGRAYLERLAKNDIVTIPSANRVIVDRVMAGEYALCLDSFLHHPIISARKGAPIAPLPLDPVLTVVSSVMLPKAPPHPYSAMLFIDYLLSKDGQGRLRDAEYFPARPDVPALPDLDKIVPRKIGLKENFIDPVKINAELPKSRAIYQELFVK